jgi:hypothetical protein
LPAPSTFDEALAYNEGVQVETGVRDTVCLVPVALEPSAKLVRVNVSFRESMLRRIDEESKRLGMTRSAFIAEAARRMYSGGR